ncbi:MAG: TetR/AcrR family transcriptional regulator [Lachnospiraceae bacterium]|nr:TetR/AcrR family transcriptional regulator [Lachnospiraceae bacterium]
MNQRPSKPIPGVNLPKTQLGWDKFYALTGAAEKLFTRSSFHEVSVSDICRAAHTAVGTFYIYFETKTDLYRYLVEDYKRRIKQSLSESIAPCTTRLEREREGCKAFVMFSVKNPTVYNIIWGSLAVDKQLFTDYYVSFAKSYARALTEDREELCNPDVMTLSYALMGISSFLGLRAIFEKMSEAEVDKMLDESFLPMIKEGIIRMP